MSIDHGKVLALCDVPGMPDQWDATDGYMHGWNDCLRALAQPAEALADAPPIPAWLIDADQSRVWAAAWETLYRAITLAKPAEAPHCKGHAYFDDGCIDCSDALERQRKGPPMSIDQGKLLALANEIQDSKAHHVQDRPALLDEWADRIRALAQPAEAVEYPTGDVIGHCICGSWPGGRCLRCPKIDAAQGVPDDLARDAARYRYLRQPNHCILYARHPNAWGRSASDNTGHVRYDTPEQLDAAIDEALAASPSPEGES